MSFFEKSVRAACGKILDDVNQKVYQISWELFSSVVNKTPSPTNPGPTAKGLLANQWYPMAGGTSASRGTSTSPSGSDSLSRIRSMMNGREFSKKDGLLTLSNNLDYAMKAEEEGWVRTSGYRMVALSLQSTAAKYKQVNIS